MFLGESPNRVWVPRKERVCGQGGSARHLSREGTQPLGLGFFPPISSKAIPGWAFTRFLH